MGLVASYSLRAETSHLMEMDSGGGGGGNSLGLLSLSLRNHPNRFLCNDTASRLFCFVLFSLPVQLGMGL